jgi:hypothetical protein
MRPDTHVGLHLKFPLLPFFFLLQSKCVDKLQFSPSI